MGRQEFGRGFNRFIKRRLQLDQQQYEQFQLLHRENIQSMQQIARELNQKRDSMMRELTREKPDTGELNRFAREIGNLHTQLKKNTIDHFTKMKELCRPEQRDELNRMIMEMAQHGRHEPGPRMGPGNRPQNRMNRN
jgi:IS30 family transposase